MKTKRKHNPAVTPPLPPITDEIRRRVFQEAGRAGGKKGSKLRWAKTPKDQRSVQAKKAINSRWAKVESGKLVPLKRVAALLSIHPETIRRWSRIDKSLLPDAKSKRLFLYAPAEIEKLKRFAADKSSK